MSDDTWVCQGCGRLQGEGMTASPMQCGWCGLGRGARAFPAYYPQLGRVINDPRELPPDFVYQPLIIPAASIPEDSTP
jgi:hypothetical protein